MAIELEAVFLGVPVEHRIDGECEQVLGAETGIEILQISEAPDEQARADEQQKRQRNLRGDQRLADSYSASAGDRTHLVL